MIQQFLQLGGVRTIEEFYKKFPTEAHFDRHVHKMRYGGGINAYAGGGNVNTSIVDYLESKGLASDMASRKKRAESMGIKNYTGTYDQNVQMLETLKKQDRASAPASTNNFKRYPGRGETFDFNYKTYEGRPDEATTKKTTTQTTKAPAKTTTKTSAKTTTQTTKAPAVMDNGWRPYAPNQGYGYGWPFAPYSNSNVTQQTTQTSKKTENKKTTTDASADGWSSWNQYFEPWMPAYQKQKVIKGTEADARYLESGMIEDKNKGVMYVIQKGKVVKTIPIMTGLNKDGEINDMGLDWM